MSEENNVVAQPEETVEEKKVETTVETKEEKKNEPSIQDLMTEIARLKRQADKASSEAADYKKRWKASLTEVEQASMEKAEKEAAREEEFKELQRKVKINDLTENYVAVGFSPERAKAMAVADYDNDAETRFKIMAEVDAEKKKAWEKEFIASRPQIAAGVGSQQEDDPFLKGFNSVKH